MPLLRRNFLQAALGLGIAPLIAGRAAARADREGADAMAKDVVMIHGANEGGWCFDQFKAVFDELGWTCHAPDLIGHGLKADEKGAALVGVGMADYLNELEVFLKTVAPQPVLLGHSMALCLPNNSRPKASRVRWSSYAQRRVLASCPRPMARNSWVKT
jgi:pimeloyl-ACP methyl ester carboxylesterase